MLDEHQRRSLVARHDGELRFTDAQFGRLRAGLEAAGRWDNTIVIVISDHGEEFWDHGGFEHGHSHFREMLRVPLIVRRPGGPAGVVRTGRARQLDVVPTILDGTGLPITDDLPGRVLDAQGARYAVAEGTLWSGDVLSIRSDAGTQLWHRPSDLQSFFAAADTFEKRPLPSRRELLDLLRAIPERPRDGQRTRQPTEEQLRQLRSLGYVR